MVNNKKEEIPALYHFYKLVCNDPNIKDFYIGSTKAWYERKRKHKVDCNNQNGKKYNEPKYKTIRANGGWTNWSMIEIERGIYIRRMAEAHEYELMAQMKSTMNRQKCFDSHSKCKHDKIKQRCTECGGSSLCDHGFQKSQCRYCSPYLCECGVWTTEGKLKHHYKSINCKQFHMKEYGRTFN